MGASFLIWCAVLVVIGVLVWMIAGFAGMATPFNRRPRGEELEGPAVRYRVPEGQDPVAVTAALAHEGFQPELDNAGGTDRVVVVPCPHGEADREHVRAAIAGAGTALQDSAPEHRPVRFLDEPAA